jgi:hypothetical protein
MNLLKHVITLSITLCSSYAMAISGSNAFICDLIEYSENLDEIRQATQEASKRGICGYAKPVPLANSEAQQKTNQKMDRERAGKALFIGGALICIAKGKCDQPNNTTGR